MTSDAICYTPVKWGLSKGIPVTGMGQDGSEGAGSPDRKSVS